MALCLTCRRVMLNDPPCQFCYPSEGYDTAEQAYEAAQQAMANGEVGMIRICRVEICPHAGVPPSDGSCTICHVISPDDRRPIAEIIDEMNRRN